MDSFTGCKVKENSPTQTELKQKDNKSFIKCTGVNKSDENKSFLKYIKGNESDPSLLEGIFNNIIASTEWRAKLFPQTK